MRDERGHVNKDGVTQCDQPVGLMKDIGESLRFLKGYPRGSSVLGRPQGEKQKVYLPCRLRSCRVSDKYGRVPLGPELDAHLTQPSF